MRILFAEDDRDLARAVKALLEHSGYSVDVVHDGRDALEYALSGGYDGVILDWMMPELSGVQVLERLRSQKNAVPCLMLTARDAVEDRVAGLDAGADDYLSKPFAMDELLARVRAMLRRKANYAPDVLRFQDIELDRAQMTLQCDDASVKLNNKAFQLMEMLAERPSAVHGVDQIMEKVWGWDSEAEINVVWVNISFLRKKLKEIGSGVEIKALRGVGYTLEWNK
ncbi:MAG: response regulator transcription factor [Christensenellales bacterium]|jgi:two-component system response regulator ArlR